MFNEQKEMGKTKWADENIPQEVFLPNKKVGGGGLMT